MALKERTKFLLQGALGDDDSTQDMINNINSGGGDGIQSDGSVAFTSDQSMGGNQLTNLGAPSASTDASTKAYVDTGVATAANKTLSNLTSPTSVNQNLIPETDDTQNIGSASKRFAEGHFQYAKIKGEGEGISLDYPTLTLIEQANSGLWGITLRRTGFPNGDIVLGNVGSGGNGNLACWIGNNTSGGVAGFNIDKNGMSLSVPINMIGSRIYGMAEPTEGDNAATKNYVDKTVFYDSSGTGGGSPTEVLTVTGLEATDTVLAITMKDEGDNSVAVRAFAPPGSGTISITFTADPGANANVRILVRKA